MKSRITNALGLCAASLILGGCATTTTTESREPAYDQTKKRVYTHEQMMKTGEQSPGAALEKLDPSVTISGSRN
jgi:hypothetical protein